MKIPQNREISSILENRQIPQIPHCYGVGHLANRLYIHWDLHTICQLDCSYCYAKKWYKSLSKWGKQTPQSTLKYIVSCISLSKLPVFLGLLGGEPTITPRFHELIELIESKILPKNETNRLYITTNCIFHKELPQNPKIRVLCSYHPEFGYADKFIANVLKYAVHHKVRINLMLIPEYKDDILKVYGALKSLDVHPHFVYENHRESLIYNCFDDFKELAKVHKEFIYNNELCSDYELFESQKNCFYNWNCYNNNYEISSGGIVKNLCKNVGVSLFENPTFFERIKSIKPMVCPHKFCNCDGLLKCLKLKTIHP